MSDTATTPPIIAKANQYRKAIAAVLIPGLVILVGALLDGSDGGSAVTWAEGVSILIACLGTGTGVALARNAPYTG